jgi:chemotaxis protein MotB
MKKENQNSDKEKNIKSENTKENTKQENSTIENTEDKVQEEVIDKETTKKSKKTSNKKTSTDKKRQKEAKKAQKAQKRKEKAIRNTRWFWFFILLLIGIVLLSILDTHRKTAYLKTQQKTIDSLRYSEHFFKSKYIEKDSALNKLLADYNTLLEKNIQNNKQLTDKQKQLLRLQKVVYLQDSILRQVKKSFELALSSYDKRQVSVKMKDGKLYLTMRTKLLFPSGSATVQKRGMPALRLVSRILKHNPNIDIVIEGHTDNVPLNPKNKKFKDNWELSTARAVAVTRILTQYYHIRPERLTAAGRSMYYPIAPNTTAAGRAKNRRIEFIMTPNLEELYKIADKTSIAK